MKGRDWRGAVECLVIVGEEGGISLVIRASLGTMNSALVCFGGVDWVKDGGEFIYLKCGIGPSCVG